MMEEDEVVQEIDVNLSDIDPLLLMFQYPLRTIDRPYGDEGELKKVTVKKLNDKISMTYGLKRDVPNYDENASSNRILQHKLSSTHVPTHTSYCVGTFKDGQFYLSPIDSIYQMRPDFDHVNKESMERLVGGAEIEIQKQKKAKEILKMQIVDDDKKEQQRKQLELELEEEQEMEVFPKDSEQAAQVINFMTHTSNQNQDPSSILLNIFSEEYMSWILPSNQNDDVQTQITKQREGEWTMDNIMKLDFKRFLLLILTRAGCININRFRSLIETYWIRNNVRLNDKAPSEITNQDIAKDIHSVCNIFKNGFCVLKSWFRYEEAAHLQPLIHLRNKIIFSLFNNDDPLMHPAIHKAQFEQFANSASVRAVLHELCENKGGKWYLKNYREGSIFDLYSEFDDLELLQDIQKGINEQKDIADKYFELLRE